MKLYLVTAISILLGGTLGLHATQALRTERVVVRDTVVVRTLGPATAGIRKLAPILSFGAADGPDPYVFGNISELRRAPDGSIWLYDSQARSLKRFDSTGKFIGAVGRSGEGPNEYGYLNGMTFLKDGTAFLWDGPKWRMLVFSGAGSPVSTWNIPRVGTEMSYAGSGSLYADDTGAALYAQMPVFDVGGSTPAVFGTVNSKTILLKLDRNGRALDTLMVPEPAKLPPRVERSVAGTGRASLMIPFSPIARWAFSPRGYFISSAGDRYIIDVALAGARPMRIERDIAPVPVTPAMRADAIDLVEKGIQRVDPAWRWANPEIPRAKPSVNWLSVDGDHRIWVSVAAPSERIPDAELEVARAPARSTGAGAAGASAPGGHLPGSHFRAPAIYDVFSEDGRFLGRVPMPMGVTPRVMIGNFMWAVTLDSLDVQHVTKFRFDPPLDR